MVSRLEQKQSGQRHNSIKEHEWLWAVTWVPSSLAMALHAVSLRHTQEAKTACNEHHIYTKDECTALPASQVQDLQLHLTHVTL